MTTRTVQRDWAKARAWLHADSTEHLGTGQERNGSAWARLEELFDQALERPMDQRHHYLESAAGDDPDLVAQVRRMLDAHVRTGVLDRRIAQLPEADLRERLSRALANQYVLDDLLGSGGMSSVSAPRTQADRTIVQGAEPAWPLHGPEPVCREVDSGRLPFIKSELTIGRGRWAAGIVTPMWGRHMRERPLRRCAAGGNAVAPARYRGLRGARAEAGVVTAISSRQCALSWCHAFADRCRQARSTGMPAVPGSRLAIGTTGYMHGKRRRHHVDHRATCTLGTARREILTGRCDPVEVADVRSTPHAGAIVDAALEPSARVRLGARLLRMMPCGTVPRAARVEGSQRRRGGEGLGRFFWRAALAMDPCPTDCRGARVDETADTRSPASADWRRLDHEGLHENWHACGSKWPAARSPIEAGDGVDAGRYAREGQSRHGGMGACTAWGFDAIQTRSSMRAGHVLAAPHLWCDRIPDGPVSDAAGRVWVPSRCSATTPDPRRGLLRASTMRQYEDFDSASRLQSLSIP